MTLTEEPAPAPPVVVVVVTSDPGEWFEDCLTALGAQDYPSLSVLVLDANSTEEVLPRVAAVLPGAYVRRLDDVPGFGVAANQAIELVEGAAFFAFCHDDVALDPDAIRVLVEEAFRSNAGIVGPKLVAWDEPGRLLQVGMGADKGGVLVPFFEPMELDQEQHDAVRDVFVIPSGCMVVRSDLFTGLGGFDPVIERDGYDLDLCWRAQVAGARVVVVPGARARHREARSSRESPEIGRPLRLRHRLRTSLICYSRVHLLRVAPQLAVMAIAEAVYALVRRRRPHARAVAAAWWWNWTRRRDIRARRLTLRAVRQFPDSEVRRLQVGGTVRVRRYVRSELELHRRLQDELADLGDELEDLVRDAPRRMAAVAWIVVGMIFVVGSRELLFGPLPWVSGFAPIDSAADLLRTWASGWRSAGLGSSSASPTAFGLLGLGGALLAGATGVLQQVLVLGSVPVGLLGVWRMTRRLGSVNARALAVVLYAAVPLPWDALGTGDWAGLVTYAAMPWVFETLVMATAEPPTDDSQARWSISRAAIGRGLLLAVAAAFVPLLVGLVVLVGVAIWIGGLLTGDGRATMRAPVVAVAMVGVVAILHVPWTLELVRPDGSWWAWGGVGWMGTEGLAARRVMSFDTGPLTIGGLGWAIPAAGALALLVGRGWRLRWAVRCWVVVLATWALTWAGGQGHLGFDMPSSRVLLAPAAVALALAGALGVVAFERDLRGYRFGWRQVASLAAAGAAVVALVPSAAGAFDGRWGLPDDDHRSTLAPVLDGDVLGGFRVLWIGRPSTLPVAGFRLGDDVAYALTSGGLRPADGRPEGAGVTADRWAASELGATPLVADALRAAVEGDTDRLGQLVAAFGVRYVVLVERAAPFDDGVAVAPLPEALTDGLGRQLDLRLFPFDPSLTVFENVAARPVRVMFPDDAAALLASNERSTSGAELSASLSLPAGDGVLEPAGFDAWEGDVVAGELFLAASDDGRWGLSVDGERVERRRALGWANSWSVDPGSARLAYDTAWARRLVLVGQVLLWLLAVGWLVRHRRRARRELGDLTAGSLDEDTGREDTGREDTGREDTGDMDLEVSTGAADD